MREILCLEKPQQVRIQRFEERPPTVPSDHIYDLLPAAIHQGIDVRAVLQCISDDSMFSEYKRDYAPGRGDNIVAGKIRIKGLPMGVIASNGVGIMESLAREQPDVILSDIRPKRSLPIRHRVRQRTLNAGDSQD